MPKRAFLSLVLGVTGNVNADAGVGVRIPLKKVISWNKEVRAFVSPRCVRRGIRGRLAEKGFAIDPQTLEKGNQLTDVGDPFRYADDDLFGYLAPQKGKGEIQPARSSPVKVSPLIALHHTEISVEFAGRFPRTDLSEEAKDANPVPFEIETAKWLGSMHVIISDRIGRFGGDELRSDLLEKIKEKEYADLLEGTREGVYELKKEERERRLKALLEILLKEGWAFPRGSEALSVPEYHYAIVILSESFIPTPNVLRMTDDMRLNVEGVKEALKLYEWKDAFLIDYKEGNFIRLTRRKEGEMEEKGGGEEAEEVEGEEEEVIEEEGSLSEGGLDGIIEAVAEFLL